MDMLHRMAGMDVAGREALLPETLRLLERILEVKTYGELKDLSGTDFPGTASYGAWPESHLPFPRFQIIETDPALLNLVDMVSPGFEVLQAACGGFQFHWRNDLSHAFETEMPLLSQFIARLPEEQTIVIEHFILPMLVRYRVRKLWGWIMLGRGGEDGADMTSLRRAVTLEQAEGACLVTRSGTEVGGRGRHQFGSASLVPAPQDGRPLGLTESWAQHVS